MTRRRSHDEAEYARQRTPVRLTNVTDLPLFATEVGIDAPSRADRLAHEAPAARRDRVLSHLAPEHPVTEDAAKRKDWIDRIYAALVAQLARSHYDGLVSANDARKVFETFPDYDATADRRFFAALWRRPGWIFVDYNGVSDTETTHGRRIMRYRYDPNAKETVTPSEAA